MVNHLKRHNNLTLLVLLPKIAFLLSCLPLIMPTHTMGMKHSLEINNHEAMALVNVPEDLFPLIIAYCDVKDSLRETCKYFDTFISNNKETVLKQELLRLNEKALTKFLVHYGSLGNSDVVRNLLAKGANPNARDNGTSWIYNTTCNLTQKVADSIVSSEVLIASEVLITRNFANEPLLLIATTNGHSNIVQLLIDYAADVTIKGNYDQTALHHASKNGNVQIAKILLDNGANSHINGRDRYGMTPLHHASINGCTSIIEMLLVQGANIHIATDTEHKNSLHYASKNDHYEAVTLLLQNGANIDARDIRDNTPLHFACEEGHTQTITVLLKNGANVNLMNHDEKTPLDLVPYQFNLSPLDENVQELLIENGGQYGPFITVKKVAKVVPFLTLVIFGAFGSYLSYTIG